MIIGLHRMLIMEMVEAHIYLRHHCHIQELFLMFEVAEVFLQTQ